MNEELLIQESAARAFNLQAGEFDILYGNDSIIRYKRERVREQVESFLAPHSQILELNAGTGEDAIYFALRGHRVHATDISGNMLEVLGSKVQSLQLQEAVTKEKIAYTALEDLEKQGPYDLIFSNFAGLNCTNRLDKVLDSFAHLLKPGGYATLVILPRFCLWEFLLLFRGKFRTAFRRFSGKKGTAAKINDQHFRCWYYNPSFIRKHLTATFDVVSLEGLCTVVPPSYIEGFAEKRPRLFHFLKDKENKWKSRWPWKLIGDYYILTLKKRS